MMTNKWKFIFLACVAIANAKSVKLPKSAKQAEKLPFEFNEVIPNAFGQSGFGGTWISGKEFTYSSGGNFTKFDVITQTEEVVLTRDYADGKGWSGVSYRYSPDRSKILVRHSQRQIFRHSTVSKFSIINPNAPESAEYKVANGEEIQTAFIAPNSKVLGYVLDNNIYTVDLDTLGLPQVITSDGETDVIYNGVPDWVYEEEVLGTDAASWFSPNGEMLAYAKFNDSQVREAVYDVYGDGQYPTEVHLRYPKAGTTNPTVGLYLVNLVNPGPSTLLIAPIDKIGGDHILGSVFWINEQSLGAFWLNRRQNRGVIVSYDATSFVPSEIMEINEPNGWIDVNTPYCDANAVCYFLNNFENWPTLTSIDTKNKVDIKRLSNGMNVLAIYGISAAGDIFFQSTPSADLPGDRHVYVSTNGVTRCLTCEVKSPEGNICSYASASFSKDFTHYTMTCSGPDPAVVEILTAGGDSVRKWQENANLRTKLERYDLPKKTYLHVPVEGGFKAAVMMFTPSHVDLESATQNTKYPMLIRVYGGPGSVRIASNFGVGFHHYQITKKNIIYVEIDGRGTGQKGLDMMFSVNNNLGFHEMEDQIAVAKYLADTYKFIDPSRVAIWGWSYGGYATAMTLAKDVDKVFKCGISVAPVTSWRFYDTIYTERYMGIDSSALNYNVSDVSTPEHVKVLGEHDFFLIHGNADDNVHYQQSMVLARALELADIQFEQLSYPDEAHSISGPQKHLYHSMDRFWDKCFDL